MSTCRTMQGCCLGELPRAGGFAILWLVVLYFVHLVAEGAEVVGADDADVVAAGVAQDGDPLSTANLCP